MIFEFVHPNVGAFAKDGQQGLTKREYFAAISLQGLLSNQSMTDIVMKFLKDSRYDFKHGKEVFSEMAVQSADALIEALNKQP